MFSQTYYAIRSRKDGSYLSARPDPEGSDRFMLMFSEHFDALSYINKYAAEYKDQLAVESISPTQLKGVLQRWGYAGLAVVRDPLLPRVEFLRQT
ncbi:hypothetical protein [Baaleninema sp.]|uniref:hypothetical protein n=1 Tax=Baaleninema sp. TaxID=3101197 RepID=UPI003CFCBBF7